MEFISSTVSIYSIAPVLKPVPPTLFAAIPFSFFHNPTRTSGSLSLWTSEDISPRASDLLLLALWMLSAAAAWLNLGRALGHRPGTPWLLSWAGASGVRLSRHLSVYRPLVGLIFWRFPRKGV